MRKFSRQYILVDGKKYHLVSVKDEYDSTYDPVAFIQKSKKKDEEGFVAVGETLKCPHIYEFGSTHTIWAGVSEWIQVQSICQKCWGVHRTAGNSFNCILRSKQIKHFKDGVART